MLSSSCPSCGAPLWFRHAAAVAAVCENCRSTVVRGDADVLQVTGKASAFPRDLSPIVLGAHGTFGGRSFVVVGVVRKARERVRWNEWYCLFEDGGEGWLGEGNGQLQVYDAFVPVKGAPEKLRAGDTVKIAGKPWQVLECDEAVVAAADGELPYPATDGAPAPYADLRRGDGVTVATLDHDFDPPRLYTGKLVTLKELRLEPIRPISGWSDPDLKAAMTGPDLQGTRSLACPNCTAPLTLRALDAASIVCGHCGSVVALQDADPAGIIGKLPREQVQWKPPLPLGARAKLRDVGSADVIEWEIIGAMERAVRAGGERFAWTEHFLFNPYHGFRWLALDHGTRQWNLIERLPDLPTRPSLRFARHGGHSYKAFQQGVAQVERVLGEFTWEVRAGDTAQTVDFVDPPFMLSVETENNEQSASLGRWVDPDEIDEAFPDHEVRAPIGTAPNQPNPFDQTATQAVFAGATVMFALATMLLFVVQLGVCANEPLLSWQGPFGTGARSSDAFTVADTLRTSLQVSVTSSLSPEKAMVHVTLLNRTDGRAYHVDAGRTGGSDTLGRVTPGEYVAVVEGAVSPIFGQGVTGTVAVRVVRDPVRYGPILFAFLITALGPVWWFGGRQVFESRRWANSDF
ncbi:MAG: DUF4178 domain-containing protein [Myxococcota bacterium]